ncbi:MAG: hypothetical protein OEL75_02510 [Kiritimatiellaceae bacterium]|nr:hypothetical protein [Kiritimatiellaceae bacterium]
MKRDIEWKEKLEDGVKRTVRVKFPGNGIVKWQFKRSDDDWWDYDTPASPEDWAMLEEKVSKLYHRRRAALRDFELVKRLRIENS